MDNLPWISSSFLFWLPGLRVWLTGYSIIELQIQNRLISFVSLEGFLAQSTSLSIGNSSLFTDNFPHKKHSPHNSTSWEYASVMKPGCCELITTRSRSFRGIQVVPAFDYSFILSHNFGCRYLAMGFYAVLEKKSSFKFILIMERISFQIYCLEFWTSTIFTTCWISIKRFLSILINFLYRCTQCEIPHSNLVFSIY